MTVPSDLETRRIDKRDFPCGSRYELVILLVTHVDENRRRVMRMDG